MRLTTIFLTMSVLSVSLPAPFAAATESAVLTTPQMTGKPADAAYPFIAQITGTNVYVRSGKSTADYPTMKLHEPDQVIVVDEEFGWAKIMPPRGSYSWIYKAYVKIDPANPGMGIVTGENVRVWAGADGIEAGRSMGFQTKMNQDPDNIDDDDIVELRPDQPESGEYYKIKPPAGAYLWISTEFLKYVGPYGKSTPLRMPARPEPRAIEPVDEATQPSGQQPRPTFTNLNGAAPAPAQPAADTDANAPADAPAAVEPAAEAAPAKADLKMTAKETEYTRQCHELSARIDEELKQPLDRQDYAATKDTLEKIKADDEAGKAAIYAQLLLDRIGRYELAQSVTAALQKQDAQLEKARQNIAKAHQSQLQQVPLEVKYLYIGQLKESAVYTGQAGPKRYILADRSGKIICYLIADSPAIDAAMQQQLGHTVGVNGSLVSSAKSRTAVVSATTVEPIQP